jgi:LuxR family maltose regulon positive regulatory protein
MAIKILLVDDHPLFRKGLRLLLEEQADFKVIGEADDGREAIDQVQRLSPDIVIMDIAMPGLNGIDATREIVSEKSSVKVVALSMHSGKRFVEDILQAGAVGYILKKSVPEDIVNGIRAVNEGEIFLSPTIAGIVVEKYKELLTKLPLKEKKEDIVPILSTKLIRPALSIDHITRPHLLERLDKGRHLPLSLLSAPAGYGKTMLVSSWLETTKILNTWVSFEENDNDFHIFMSYFLTAIKFCQESESSDLDRETVSMLNTIPLPPVSAFFEMLINELEQIQTPFILVFDDFHFIKNEAVLDLLTQLLTRPPKLMHLVLISRRDMSLKLSTLRAKGSIMETRARDLRFNTVEVASFLRNLFGNHIDSAIVNTLEKMTEGWVTGLRLTALSMLHQRELDPKLLNPTVDTQYVMEYFFVEAFAKQPPEIMQYLIRTSILDHFCGPLVNAVCLEDDEQGFIKTSGFDFIRSVLKKNLFLIPLDSENKWFRFHHLFQKHLQNQLKRHLDSEEIKLLHIRASQWFVKNNLINDALKHSQNAEDVSGMTQLVSKYGMSFMNNNQYSQLEKFFTTLPRNSIEQNPEFIMLKAWIYYYKNNWLKMMEYVKKLEALSGNLPDTRSIQANLNALKGIACYISADGEKARILLERACENISFNQFRSLVATQFFKLAANQMIGNLAAGLSIFQKELEKSVSHNKNFHAPYLARLPFVYFMDGDLTNMKQVSESAITVSKNHLDSESTAHAYYHLGIVNYFRNEMEMAEENLTKALKGSRYAKSGNLLGGAYYSLALTYQVQGKKARAKEISKARMAYFIEANNIYMLSMAQAFDADLALRQGHLATASNWADKHHNNPIFLQSTFRFYCPQSTLIKVYLAQDTADSRQRASDLLDEFLAFFQSIHQRIFQIELLALQALLYHSQGNLPKALKHLAQALYMAEPHSFIRPFIDLGPGMADLLSQMASQKISTGYINRITAALADKSRNTARPSASPLIEPLTIRENEILNLLGQRLSNKEIAENLFIAPATVKKHLANIYGKLAVGDRRQAVEKAQAMNIHLFE